MSLGEELVHTVQRDSSRVGLEVCPRTIPLDSVAPLWNVPLEFHWWPGGGLRQPDLDTVPGRLDQTSQVYQPGQSCRPQASNGTTASIEGQVIAGPFVKPARRHRPAIFVTEVAFLWLRYRCLIPWVAFVDRVAEWVAIDECSFALPVIIVGTAQQNANAQVDIYQACRHQLPIHDNSGRDEHGTTPLFHRAIVVVAHIRVLPRSPAA